MHQNAFARFFEKAFLNQIKNVFFWVGAVIFAMARPRPGSFDFNYLSAVFIVKIALFAADQQSCELFRVKGDQRIEIAVSAR